MDTSRKPSAAAPVKPQLLEVDAAHAGRRLDNYLLPRLGLPRSALYRLLRRGRIRVDGGRVGPEHRIAAGERIRIPPLSPAPASPTPAARPMPPLSAAVLYEDAQLLALDKPAGLAVHGGSGLATDLRRQARYHRQCPLELVHRLDKQTSGCLLLCSDPGLLSWLHERFRRGEITKTYLALVGGRPPARMDIRFPLRRLSGGGVAVQAGGRTAHTRLRVVRRYGEAALVQLRPYTGRTHQLRVHTAEVGYPIAGDTRYGMHDFNRALRKVGLRRLFLHARTLRVPLPTGRCLCLKAPLPASLHRILQALEHTPLGYNT